MPQCGVRAEGRTGRRLRARRVPDTARVEGARWAVRGRARRARRCGWGWRGGRSRLDGGGGADLELWLWTSLLWVRRRGGRRSGGRRCRGARKGWGGVGARRGGRGAGRVGGRGGRLWVRRGWLRGRGRAGCQLCGGRSRGGQSLFIGTGRLVKGGMSSGARRGVAKSVAP